MNNYVIKCLRTTSLVLCLLGLLFGCYAIANANNPVFHMGSNCTSCGLGVALNSEAGCLSVHRILTGYLGSRSKYICSFTLFVIPLRQESTRRSSNWQWVGGEQERNGIPERSFFFFGTNRQDWLCLQYLL